MIQISIIIPVYNAEQYLYHCVRSILEQSCQDFELILVDDGSVDQSGEICNQYAETDARIQVIHTANRGPAAARKIGVEHATGQYVTFVDADDWLDQDMLAFGVEKLQEKSADILCMGHKEVERQGDVKIVKPRCVEEIEMTEAIEMMRQLHGTRLIDSGPWAKMIRRKLFEGIDFCEEVTIGEDYFMVLQLLEKANKAVLCGKPLYNRCIRPTSISRSGYSKRHRLAFEQYMRWRIYLLDRYPELKDEITGYHTEYEMAVITAMCRNKQYDLDVIRKLKQDLRKNRNIVLRSRKTPLYMRASAVMIAYCWPVFIVFFRMIHIMTGR
jgi:glycosyltransferase involved in cell wall biosynthesis